MVFLQLCAWSRLLPLSPSALPSTFSSDKGAHKIYGEVLPASKGCPDILEASRRCLSFLLGCV